MTRPGSNFIKNHGIYFVMAKFGINFFVATKLIGYHLFVIEVGFLEGMFLFYLEVGVVGCMTFNDNLLEINLS